MVQTRNMAITRQPSSSDVEMETSPRKVEIPEITNTPHNEQAENKIVALIPSNNSEPTLLEITEPDITFEALSSQL